MLGARSAGTVTPFRREKRDADVGDELAVLLALVEEVDVAAHLAQREVEADAGRVSQHALDRHVGARHQQRRRRDEGGRARIARHRHVATGKLRIALDRDARAPIAYGGAHFGAEIAQHPLGVVARRLGLDDGGLARCMQPGDEDRALHLRGGYGELVLDRHEARGPARDKRKPVAVVLHLQPHLLQRPQHPTHRPPAERGIPHEPHRHVVAGDHAQHQSRAGAGVAEIERGVRLAQAADAAPLDAPLLARALNSALQALPAPSPC